MGFSDRAFKAGVGLVGLGSIAAVITGVVGLGGNLKRHESILKNTGKIVAGVSSYGTDKEKRENIVARTSELFSQAQQALGLSKWKEISDDKSGVVGYWNGKYDVEVYRINKMAYIGNRRYNKPKNANFQVDLSKPMTYQVGYFNGDAVEEDGYVGYDSDSLSLILGNVDDYKLSDWVLTFDEQDSTPRLFFYDKGKSKGYIDFSEDADALYYISDSKAVAKYDLDKNKFVDKDGNIPDSKISIKQDGYDVIIKSNNCKWTWNVADGVIDFKGENIKFSGNAFKNTISYKHSDDKEVKYKWTTMVGIELEDADGTKGEVKFVNKNTKSFFENFADLLSDAGKTGANYAVDEIINSAVNCIPYLGAINTLSGGEVSNCARELLSDTVKEATGKSIDEVIDGESDEGKKVKPSPTPHPTPEPNENDYDYYKDNLDPEEEDGWKKDKSTTDKIKDGLHDLFN